jgi:hypothetical protein
MYDIEFAEKLALNKESDEGESLAWETVLEKRPEVTGAKELISESETALDEIELGSATSKLLKSKCANFCEIYEDFFLEGIPSSEIPLIPLHFPTEEIGWLFPLIYCTFFGHIFTLVACCIYLLYRWVPKIQSWRETSQHNRNLLQIKRFEEENQLFELTLKKYLRLIQQSQLLFDGYHM